MTEPSKTSNAGGRRARISEEELARAVPRGTGGNEVRVGIFVLVGILSFLMVLFLLTDPATMRGRYMLVTTVEDAGGVRRGDPVQMRGVIIGRINSFEMLPDERVAITMELEGEWRIPEGSRTRLGAAGLFGGRTLEVLPANRSEAFYQEWDTIPGSDGGTGLMGAAEELSGKAGHVLSRIEDLLDARTVESVQGSAGELETLLGELSAVIREQRSTLRSLTESVARSAEGLESAAAAGPDAARAIARADSAMSVLTRAGENLDGASAALRTLLERMDRGEGTLGRLARDEALYDNLNRAAVSVAELVEDLRENPGRYVNISIF